MRADGEDTPSERLDATSRRTFIKRASFGAAELSLSGLLAACGSSGSAGAGPGGLPLAGPNAPVKLPVYSNNKPIASGREPEPGPLLLYNWLGYINPDVVTDFERKYDVKVRVDTFTTIDEAFAKLSSGAVQYDVFVPEPVLLERLVAGKLLQPLELSYIPNLERNVWRSLRSPWYDVGPRYTVPYTVYSTGVGWRADKLPGFTPAALTNPWTALWAKGPSIKGRVGMLDAQHDALAMALLHDGVTDVNTENARFLGAARNAIVQLIDATNLRFDTDEYQRLADGELWLHQAWSGDMAAISAYVPRGTHSSVFRYWWPSDGRGPVTNDTLAVLRGARSPVLAHLFINHLLDVDEAFKNFSFTYYQQPLRAITPEAAVKRGLVVPNLQNTLIRESQWANGLARGALSTSGQVLWDTAWARVKAA